MAKFKYEKQMIIITGIFIVFVLVILFIGLSNKKPVGYSSGHVVQQEQDVKREALRSEIVQDASTNTQQNYSKQQEALNDSKEGLSSRELRKSQRYTLHESRKTGEEIIHERRLNGLDETGRPVKDNRGPNVVYRYKSGKMVDWTKENFTRHHKKQQRKDEEYIDNQNE